MGAIIMSHQVYQLSSVVEMTVASIITIDNHRIGVDWMFPINIIATHADQCAGKHQNEMLREIHRDKDSMVILMRIIVKLSLW